MKSLSAAPPDLNRHVEVQLRKLWIEHQLAVNESTNATLPRGPCQAATCIPQYFGIHIYAVDPSIPRSQLHEFMIIPVDDVDCKSPLHACIEKFCYCDNPAYSMYHWKERTDAFADCQFAQSGITGGGVYWCAGHTRMHVCTSNCTNITKTSIGTIVCVLSGREIRQKDEVMYGDGLTILTHDLEDERAKTSSTIRKIRSAHRSGLTNVQELIQTSTARHTELYGFHAEDTETQQLEHMEFDDEDVYADMDEPADNLFPDNEDNTFGAEMTGELNQIYAHAYALVALLIFSDERSKIEARNRHFVRDRAEHQIRNYIDSQKLNKEPVFLDVCQQLQDRAFASRYVYPQLLVAPCGIPRLTAYFAVLVMEFYLQLIDVLHQIAPQAPVRARTYIEKFLGYPFGSVAPNILDVMREGLSMERQTILRPEPMLGLYPESNTLEELGIPQKLCTEVKKCMKQCIIHAVPRVPIAQLQITQLDLTAVFNPMEPPVVSQFLIARRHRLMSSALSFS